MNSGAGGDSTSLASLRDSVTPTDIYDITAHSDLVTFPENVSFYTSFVNGCRKIGKIVIVYFSLKIISSSNSLTRYDITGYIPDGFRPPYNTNALGDFGNGDGRSTAIRFNTDGSVTFYTRNAETIYCVGTCTYFIS